MNRHAGLRISKKHLNRQGGDRGEEFDRVMLCMNYKDR